MGRKKRSNNNNNNNNNDKDNDDGATHSIANNNKSTNQSDDNSTKKQPRNASGSKGFEITFDENLQFVEEKIPKTIPTKTNNNSHNLQAMTPNSTVKENQTQQVSSLKSAPQPKKKKSKLPEDVEALLKDWDEFEKNLELKKAQEARQAKKAQKQQKKSLSTNESSNVKTLPSPNDNNNNTAAATTIQEKSTNNNTNENKNENIAKDKSDQTNSGSTVPVRSWKSRATQMRSKNDIEGYYKQLSTETTKEDSPIQQQQQQ